MEVEDETPVIAEPEEEAPAEETPVEETPAEETPVEEEEDKPKKGIILKNW